MGGYASFLHPYRDAGGYNDSPTSKGVRHSLSAVTAKLRTEADVEEDEFEMGVDDDAEQERSVKASFAVHDLYFSPLDAGVGRHIVTPGALEVSDYDAIGVTLHLATTPSDETHDPRITL